MKVFFKKAKRYLNSLSRRVFIVAILTFLVASFLTARAVFQEPAAAPSSSDQDFAENILGANNADNDYGSSSVAANRDGSIIERLEYAIGLISTPTCGNGSVEGGEACDDGGTLWTSGSCAGDCSRRNYWSSPMYASGAIGAGTFSSAENINKYCQERGFRVATSNNTVAGDGIMNYKFLNISSSASASIIVSSASASYSTQDYATNGYTIETNQTSRWSYSYSMGYTSSIWYPGWRKNLTQSASTTGSSTAGNAWAFGSTSFDGTNTWYFYTNVSVGTFSYSSKTTTSITQPSSNIIISEIWCAD